MTKTQASRSCPICERVIVDEGVPPFCSARCRSIDLGQWLGGRYRIAGERHVDEQRLPSSDRDEP